jgi:cob(I)alamin adenosyltransferase
VGNSTFDTAFAKTNAVFYSRKTRYNSGMLFTGKGDGGTTTTFGCNQRIVKSSAVAEALGNVDEINSLLGVVKMTAKDAEAIDGARYSLILDDVQQDLFIVQAELAGADKKMDENRVKKLEGVINDIEKELPPIKSFFVSGGTELAARCDFARTVARRAERRVVAALLEDETSKKKKKRVEETVAPAIEHPHKELMAYMNRLSSLLYALARLANHQAGITEEKPHY